MGFSACQESKDGSDQSEHVVHDKKLFQWIQVLILLQIDLMQGAKVDDTSSNLLKLFVSDIE